MGLRKISRAAFFVLSAFAFHAFLFPPAFCSAQEAAKFQVALLNVRDVTLSPSESTRYQMFDMLRLQLKQTPFFEMKKEDIVDLWLTKTKIVSSDEETAADMARGLGLDGVFLADIYELTKNEKTKEVHVELQLQLIDKKGDVISKTYVYAASGRKPGFTGEMQLLVQEALQNAAASSIDVLQKNLTTKGIVTDIKGNGIVAMNLNLSHGIKKGAQFLVTRNGQKIARLVAVEAGKANTLAQITELASGKFVSPSDNVQLVFNPLPEPKSEAAKLKAKSSKSSIKTLTSILVAGGLVALLASGKKSDAQAQSPSTSVTISISANPTKIIADNKAKSTITAMVKYSSNNVVIEDGSSVTFKATGGTLLNGTATTGNGEASVELISGSTPGTAAVTASYLDTSTSVTVSFSSVTLTLSASPVTITADGEATSTITAVVINSETNVPVPDETEVSFSTTAGKIVEKATTVDGIATTTLTSTSSTSNVTATITAQSAGSTATTNFTFPP